MQVVSRKAIEGSMVFSGRVLWSARDILWTSRLTVRREDRGRFGKVDNALVIRKHAKWKVEELKALPRRIG